MNAFDIAKRSIGVAHVAVIGPRVSEYLSQELGREFSVSHQAVRVYRPGFSEDLDEPFAHPLALAQEITRWENGGATAYANILVSKSLAKSVAHEEAERVVPSFLSVKEAAARIRISSVAKAGHTNNEIFQLFEKENEGLRKQLEQRKSENDALLIIAEQERDDAVASSQQAQENNRHLRRRIESLELQLKSNFIGAINIPNSLENVKDWCEEQLSGYVMLHSRAYRGLKNSLFNDVPFIYRVLVMLRDFYVPMKRSGGDELMKLYKEKCLELGLTEEPSGSETRAGEQGEEYFVKYGGKRIYLDRHLKKGNSREEKNCFRAYFFWDDESKHVVIGWLPSHLDTRIT